MKQNLHIIQNAQGVTDLINYLQDKEYVAYDTETTGLDKDSTIIGVSVCASEDEAFYIILARWNVANSTLEKDQGTNTAILPLIRLLKTKSLIAHNAVFDCMITENYFKVSLINSIHTDTLVAAHLLDENRRVGLKDLAVSVFGQGSDVEAKEMKASVVANGGTITKDNYQMYKAESTLMAKYGAKDALLTYKLFLKFVPELYAQGLNQFFYEDESMPLLKGPTYQLNTTGLKVDSEGLTTLKKTLEAECAEKMSTVMTEISSKIRDKYPGTNAKNTFNIGSSQQLAWLLFEQYRLEFGTLTDSGKLACKDLGLKIPYHAAAKRQFIYECQQRVGTMQAPEALVNGDKVRAKKFKQPWAYIACDKKTLQLHATKHKWIQALLHYQKNQKILSTYIEGIESRVKYGVIHPSFLQTGTTSGRYSSRNPNFQNLPRDDKRVKKCFVSRPGKTFVGADFSQLEPRAFASVSQDPNLLAAFRSGEDFYSTIGIPVFNAFDSTPYKDGSPDAFGIKYSKERKMSKEIALATTYGANEFRLSGMIGKSVDETREIIQAYFEKFVKVRQMMLDSHEIAKRDGQVTSIFGRPRRMPDAKKISKIYGNVATEDLPYEVRNLLNLAVNHRIQSTAASICNRAMIKFYQDAKALGLDTRMVSQIHDEIIVECLDADVDTVSLLLQNAMETAVELPGVALEAIPATSKTIGGLK